MPVLTPRTLRQQYPEATTAESPEGVQARAVSSVSYELPEGLVTKSVTYSYERLLLGGLMLLDEEHPLPDGAPAPNTMSVATYGKGMVPVKSSHRSSAMRSSAVSCASSPDVVMPSQSFSSDKAVGASTAGVMIARFMAVSRLGDGNGEECGGGAVLAAPAGY